MDKLARPWDEINKNEEAGCPAMIHHLIEAYGRVINPVRLGHTALTLTGQEARRKSLNV